MSSYSPAWPHSDIREVFPNLFFVMGTNVTHYNGVDLQHSRNMVIVKRGGELSLINTVRLDDKGLAALDALGVVKNVIRIGAFHGRDDAFYLDKYTAKMWAMKGVERVDVELKADGVMPFVGCSFLPFATAQVPEGVLHIEQDGGVLVTCDSIKNWTEPDPFFSEATAKLYQQQGFFGAASISSVWTNATQVQSSDFEKIIALPFRHLISAHGEPLLNTAHARVVDSVWRAFENASTVDKN